MNRSMYRRYPFLDTEEFAEVCHHLDNRYCQATLGPVRKQWKLRVHTALDLSPGANSEYATVVQITRPLEDTGDLDELGSYLGSFSIDAAPERSPNQDMSMEVDEDEEELVKKPPRPRIGHVKYEIHLHPTYQAPCLWFSLHDLPADELAFNIDTVFRRLVPEQFKSTLRSVGLIGGISVDVSFGSCSCFFLLLFLSRGSCTKSQQYIHIGRSILALPRRLT
jgi:ubiquitin-like-conjugating enzyme ATG10